MANSAITYEITSQINRTKGISHGLAILTYEVYAAGARQSNSFRTINLGGYFYQDNRTKGISHGRTCPHV